MIIGALARDDWVLIFNETKIGRGRRVSTTQTLFTVLLNCPTINPVKGRGANWLHFAIQV